MAAWTISAEPHVAGLDWLNYSPKVDAAAPGELLLAELNCVACHAVSDPIRARLNPRAAPDLKAVGKRLEPHTVSRFIENPGQFKPGTTMPGLFSGDDQSPSARAAITAFLTKNQTVPARPKINATAERGRDLFHSIGCAACHATPKSDTTGGVRSEFGAPLGLGPHYDFDLLVNFLRDPLAVRASGRMPGLHLSPIDAADVAFYLIQTATPLERPFAAAEARSDSGTGQQLFSERGCAACHDLGGGFTPAPGAKALKLLDSHAKAGCLSDQPRWPAADYNLSPSQRQALRLALEKLQSGEITPWTSTERVHRRMAQFQCYACHARDGLGGPTPDRLALFTGDEELGNEGRLPPNLTHAGHRLRAAAIRDIVERGSQTRPYMKTRMPAFGSQLAAALAAALVEADGEEPSDLEPAFTSGDVAVGRELMGVNGFACITCHPWRDHAALGIQALNLSAVTERLRPEYFRRLLLEPSVVRPGTLMPSFFLNGTSPRSDILGGDVEKQIASLWRFLAEGHEAPNGYPPALGEFELRPGDRPLLLRCFMKGAGTHAIAVGFPESVHVAFDAARGQAVLAWRGRFMDAYTTWFSRFQAPVAPLGTNVVTLPETIWRSESGDLAGFRWQGYELDSRRFPIFAYEIDGTPVKDRLEPGRDGQALQRILQVGARNTSLVLEAPASSSVEVRPIEPAFWKSQAVVLPAGENVQTVRWEYRW